MTLDGMKESVSYVLKEAYKAPQSFECYAYDGNGEQIYFSTAYAGLIIQNVEFVTFTDEKGDFTMRFYDVEAKVSQSDVHDIQKEIVRKVFSMQEVQIQGMMHY